jgi:putative ABC transport system permease protein
VLRQHVRYALRSLRQSPGFALTSIAVLALGIGANTAIFSVVYTVMLRPLPYPDPSRLVFVWQKFPGVPAPFNEHTMAAPQNYLEWRRQSTSFEAMAAFRTRRLDETGGPGGKVITTLASAGLFRLLGVQARVGRLFRAEEEKLDRERVAVLSERYLHRRFPGGNALGQSITLEEASYRVIGVLPASFYLPRTLQTDEQPDVIVPLPDVAQNAGDHSPLVVPARLRPGVSVAHARVEMAGIAARLAKRIDPIADFYKLGSIAIFPFSEENIDLSLNRALYLLLAAAGLVLLIACANLANLTLARASRRSREILVRLALGATRGNVVAQLLSEALLLSFAGAACGVALAHGSIRLIQALKPPDIADLQLIAINLPVLGFTIGVATVTSIVFGLGPALGVSGADLASRIKSGGGWGASAARFRSRQFLIVSEVALALMLVAGAGLMIRSLEKVASIGVGFDAARLMALDVSLPVKRYPDASKRVAVMRDLLLRAQAIPGVAGAALTSALPLHSVGINNFHIAGREESSPEAAPVADVAQVSPTFFAVMGLRLEAGRWLTDADLTSEGMGKSVAMVNRAFVRKYFPGENPLGRLLVSGDRKMNSEIVGIAADFRAMGAENEARAEIFLPSLDMENATLVVRGAGASTGRRVLEMARTAASNFVGESVKPVDEYAAYWTAQRRFHTLVLELFAGLAMMLAMSGIYGVFSHLVASRTRELGIRMAIGATPRAIGWLVLRQCLGPLAMGVLAGIAGFLALGRVLQSLLFEVKANDPVALGVAVSAVLLAVPGALWLPLRRAGAVECTAALRQD